MAARCFARFLVASVGLVMALPVHADAPFNTDDLRSIAPLFERAECAQHCEGAEWNIKGQTFPKGAGRSLTPDDALFAVSAKWCGSRGCVEAYVLRGATHLVILKAGYALSRIAPLSASDIPPPGSRTKLPRLARSLNELQPAAGVALVAKIDKALARLPKPSANLYETNSVPGTISSKLTEMTAGILGTRDLRVAYDNFYHNSVDYAGAVEITLLGARNAARNNDAEEASRLYQAALRYEQQFYLNEKAAIETFNGNIDAVIVLTKGIDPQSKSNNLGVCGSSNPLKGAIPDYI